MVQLGVRKEALLYLSQLYRRYVLRCTVKGGVLTEDASLGDSEPPELLHVIAGFRHRILSAHWFPDLQDKVPHFLPLPVGAGERRVALEVLCEKLVWTCLVPYQLGTAARMRRLLELFTGLGGALAGRQQPIPALIACFRTQALLRKLLRDIIDLHYKEEGFADRDPAIQALLRKLAAEFPDTLRAHENLKNFYILLCKEPDLLKSLEYLVGTDYTCAEAQAKVVGQHLSRRLGRVGFGIAILERVASAAARAAEARKVRQYRVHHSASLRAVCLPF